MKIIERLYKIIPATFPRFHISIERWKFNKEYEVWVSNHGNILDKEKNPIRVKTSNKRYMVCIIQKKLVSVHRLVLMTWQPREDANTLTVDHINSNPRDNRLVNLEWVSEEENVARAKENQIVIPLTLEERKLQKQIQKETQRIIKREAEKKVYNGYSKEQIKDLKLTELTNRFLEGTVWLNHTGFILNKDNYIEFATVKNGIPAAMPHNMIARRFINAGYSSQKYCGWHWKLCGDTEINAEKV